MPPPAVSPRHRTAECSPTYCRPPWPENVPSSLPLPAGANIPQHADPRASPQLPHDACARPAPVPASRMIPRIDVSSLFSGTAAARAAVDAAIMAAAAGDGFMMIHGLPADLTSDADRRRALLRLFGLPPAVTRTLWRQKFDPAH